ncbi:MAG: DUF1192 domain-containing protein [Sphingomonadales bacterium]|jgi:uncharacterized small protein (DUF1192 family)
MDMDDMPLRKDGALKQLQKEDLDPYSLEALNERIEVLRAEITRSEAAIKEKSSSRSAAEALFNKS